MRTKVDPVPRLVERPDRQRKRCWTCRDEGSEVSISPQCCQCVAGTHLEGGGGEVPRKVSLRKPGLLRALRVDGSPRDTADGKTLFLVRVGATRVQRQAGVGGARALGSIGEISPVVCDAVTLAV